MTNIRVLSTLAVMGAMRELTRHHETETGAMTTTDFAPTVALLERLRAGETPDIAILTAQAIDDLIRQGIMRPGSRTDMALSFVGVAVKTGASKPDISSVTAFRSALLAARSIAYSKIGASGIFFADLIQRLGIAAEVNAKAIIVPAGFTAEYAASGKAELAIQQVSELMVVPGIEVVGKLPPEIQTAAMFSAGMLVNAPQAEPAGALLRYLASPAIAPILRQTGLEPPPRGTHQPDGARPQHHC